MPLVSNLIHILKLSNKKAGVSGFFVVNKYRTDQLLISCVLAIRTGYRLFALMHRV